MKTEVYGIRGETYHYERQDPQPQVVTVTADRDNKEYLMKRLDQETELTQQKIRMMLSQQERRQYCVWPVDLAFHNGRQMGILFERGRGVTLRQAAGSFLKPWLENPENGSMHFTGRIAAARTLAQITEQFHQSGDIIGAFSADNILIDEETGQVRLTGCETFRLKMSTGGYYPCDAADPESMLQGKNGRPGSAAQPGKAADLYLLAGWIFLILTGCRYDPALDTERIFTDEVRRRFDYALRTPYSELTEYDSAQKWDQLLGSLAGEIRDCPRIALHQYCARLEECPWCRERQLTPEPEVNEQPVYIPPVEETAPEENTGGEDDLSGGRNNREDTDIEPAGGSFLESRTGFVIISLALMAAGAALFIFVLFPAASNTIWNSIYRTGRFDQESMMRSIDFNRGGMVPAVIGTALALVCMINRFRKGSPYKIYSAVVIFVIQVCVMIAAVLLVSMVGALLPVLIGIAVLAGVVLFFFNSRR